jgi:hypothetical protein
MSDTEKNFYESFSNYWSDDNTTENTENPESIKVKKEKIVKRERETRARKMTFTFEFFDKEKSKFSRWIERFEIALKLYKIPEANNKGMLI